MRSASLAIANNSYAPCASCPVKCVMNFDDFRLNNINMQKFQHAHWPRARQLFPNSAKS